MSGSNITARREAGLGIALPAWLAEINPAMNEGGLDLLQYQGNWHFLLVSPSAWGPQPFSLRPNTSVKSACGLPQLKAVNTEG